MDKRGQISKVFVFMLAAIMIVFILVAASHFLSRIFNSNDRAQLERFKKEFSEQTQQVGFGDSREIYLSSPNAASMVCVYDNTKDLSIDPMDWEGAQLESLIPKGNNVFLLKQKKLVEFFRVDRLQLKEKVIECFEFKDGQLRFRAEGGDFGAVILSNPT